MPVEVRRWKTKRGNDAISITWTIYMGRWSVKKRILVWIGIAALWVVISLRLHSGV